jgi:hypothetical protein
MNNQLLEDRLPCKAANTTNSHNRFSILEIDWGPKHSRKGFRNNTD